MDIALRALRRRRLAAVSCALALLAGAAAVIFSLEPRYRATALLALETREMRLSDVSAVTTSAAKVMDPNIARSEAEILGSEGLARQVIQDLNLIDVPEFTATSPVARLRALLPVPPSASPRDDDTTDADRVEIVLATYLRQLSVFNDGRSYVINLGFQAADRRLAARIVNRHAELYLERQRAVKDQALSTAAGWLDREVSALFRRLQDAERAVQEYRSQHRLFSARGTPLVQQQLADLGGELARARADLAVREARIQQAGTARVIEADLALARLREGELSRIVNDLERQLASSEGEESGARTLDREAAAIRALYESLLSRQKQVAAQVGVQQPDAQIVSRAVPPVRPAFPNKTLLLAVAAMVSCGAALSLALLLERRRRGFESLCDAEAEVGLRALAALPRLPRRSTLEDTVLDRSRSAAAEAIRTLRSALASRPGGAPRVLAITSALPGEGKTAVALALARSLAGSGLHVLLVEADLRRGRLLRDACGRQSGKGVLAVLQGRVGLAGAVCQDRVQSLDILAVDGEVVAPTDLLESDDWGRMLKEAKDAYDYVILDTPPVEAVSDALLVGRIVEGTLLVIRATVTPAAAVSATVKAYRDANMPLFGFVLNAVDLQRGGTRTGFPQRGRANAYVEA